MLPSTSFLNVSWFCLATYKLVCLAGVAQLVAQAICNRQVVGSSPTTGSKQLQVNPACHNGDCATTNFLYQALARATSNIARAAALETFSDGM